MQEAQFYKDYKSSIKRQRLKTLVAILSIFVTILGCIILLNFFASELIADGRVINLAGSQRMRSQLISKLALKAIQGEDVKQELKATNQKFLDIHNTLINGNQSLRIKAPSEKVFIESFTNIQQEFDAIHTNAEEIINNLYPSNSVDSFAQNILSVEQAFLRKMDAIVTLYEKDSNTNLFEYRLFEAIMVSIVAIIILCEIVFVFRPTYKKLIIDMERLSEMEMVVKQVENTMIITDANGITLWVNDAFKKLTGYNKEEIIGKKPGDILQGELTSQETIEKIGYGLKTKAPFYVEIINYHKLGLPYWVNLQITPVLNVEGNIEKFISVQSDISERKNAEERIKKANIQLVDTNKLLEDQKEELNQQAARMAEFVEEIHENHEKVKLQSVILEKQNKHIKESINYAKRIQNAITSDDYIFRKFCADYFIYNQPKDIVSGDFLWTSKINNTIFFVVADCTGHGVPGAMMSAIGINLLDRITGVHKMTQPHIILQTLQFELKKLLKRNDSSVDDGMDLGMVALDLEAKKLLYAGAHHNLLLTKKNNPQKIEIVKGNRFGIGGIYAEMLQNFTSYSFDLEDIHRVFMFTDGLKDQFGDFNTPHQSNKDRKFGQKKAIQILENHFSNDLRCINKAVEEQMGKWMGLRKQTDDILMIGFELNHDLM